MRVVETFTSIQGEGYYIGYPAFFIRFAGCNLRCKWCDTKYALEKDAGYEKEPSELVKVAKYSKADKVVLTGGEPMLQPVEEFNELVIGLTKIGKSVHVETNGTIKPTISHLPNLCHWIVSPKLPSSGMHLKYCAETLREFERQQSVEFKFVIADLEDYYAAKHLTDELLIRHVVLQPLHNNLRLMKQIIEWNKLYSWNVRVLPQLHKLLWGGARGK